MLSRETMQRRLHLADEHYRRRARRSFAEVIRHTKPDYQLSWFHEELARFYELVCEQDLEVVNLQAQNQPLSVYLDQGSGCSPSTIRISAASDGTQADNVSSQPHVDGSFVVFASLADNLIANDTN